MVGAISSSAAYLSVQRYTPENSPVKKPSVPAAESSFNAELSVSSQAAVPSSSEPFHPGDTMNADTYACELFGKMRLSPAGEEEDLSAQTEKTPLKEEHLEKKQEAEQLAEEKKAEEKREAYLEALKEKEEARAERVEKLKEAQSEGEDPAGAAEEETETSEGALTFDRTAAMLQNYQMNYLIRNMLSAQANGQDASPYRTALDAMLLKTEDSVHFSGKETAYSPYAQKNPVDERFLLAS